ncbi:N-acetyltransferase [Streptomyces sp. NPDC051018]|uniref:N-acetyltransferase n=1 Tax=Streptomyces sp. NPDC051018 TaxID=3365639 RepID=UPI00379318BD
MSASPQVRPFHREDRDQLTVLVNAHAAAVIPGAGVSVNTVLSSLERCPEEYVTDPWVTERLTFVVEHERRIVAAAHLLRYRDDPDVGDGYRDTGHLAWFLHFPSDGASEDGSADAPGPASGEQAAELLMSACLAQLTRWKVRTRLTDGQLPVPGVAGVPEQWPHVRATLERAGFVHTGHTEILLIAAVSELPSPGPAPLPGLTLHRTLGELGTRFTVRLDGRPIAYAETSGTLERPERHARPGGLADLADLELPEDPHPGLLPWLLGEIRQWLALSGVDRVLAYSGGEDDTSDEFTGLTAHGFRELSRSARGWTHRAG